MPMRFFYPRERRGPHETEMHWLMRQRNRRLLDSAEAATEVRDGREWRVLRLPTDPKPLLPEERPEIDLAAP